MLACGDLILSTAARADGYPSRPVKIIVPFPPGGSNVIIARILAQKLSEKTEQSFIVENRAGAGGNIGAEAVAAASVDGYTLMVTAPPPPTTNAALYKSLPFDPATAFAPITLLAAVPIVLMVHPSLPDVPDLVALGMAKPGTIHFGSSGIGTANHLAGWQCSTTCRPACRRSRPAASAPSRVAGAARAAALPKVPRVAEPGVPGFEAFAWFGMIAPVRTPEDVLAKLESDVAAILATPGMKRR